MIAEIVSETYDHEGSRTSNPNYKKKGYCPPTFPLGAFISQPLEVKCDSISDLRQFLKNCRYVSDMEQFDKGDHWMPPEDFERVLRGDCEDIAFYTWRQLTEMGYESRVVLGRVGAVGHAHAWVQYENDGRCYIVEPQMAFIGETLPRLSVIRHKPVFSITWNGDKMEEYIHEPKKYDPSFSEAAGLFGEWILYWSKFWLMNGWKIPLGLVRMPFKIYKARGKKL